jgi:hypothetical protein
VQNILELKFFAKVMDPGFGFIPDRDPASGLNLDPDPAF